MEEDSVTTMEEPAVSSHTLKAVKKLILSFTVIYISYTSIFTQLIAC